MEFKSVSEILENYYGGSLNYESVCHEPKKDQIKADAMVYLIKFIDWCFKKDEL
jgi:hypothetical protein